MNLESKDKVIERERQCDYERDGREGKVLGEVKGDARRS